MTLYEIRGVSHRYRMNGHHAQALSDVDLDIKKGEDRDGLKYHNFLPRCIMPDQDDPGP